ncbi:MAG: hypothetical protein IIZ10_06275 [Solobacterium sp.]|nr:hypothetical protein [Solobacterium sp.]
MRYIFTALRNEAADLIRELHLKPADTSLQCYENENTVLTVTGTGPLSAASACAAVLFSHHVTDRDIVINAGIAAAIQNGRENELYVIHKIHDASSDRDYYPDLIPAPGVPEAELITGAKPYRASNTALSFKSDAAVLYDMEGAAVFHAASMFLPPHRIRLLKLVSDFGETGQIQFDPAWSSMIKNAVLQEAERMETVPPHPEKQVPDCAALAQELHATVAMKRRLEQALRYAELAGIDWNEIVRQYREDGLLPSADKEAGKQILERLIYDIQD